MKKEDIVRKLTSRKFWAAVIAFVTSLLIYHGSDAGTIESITSLIMAGASVVAYILGEGWADAASAGSTVTIVDTNTGNTQDAEK